MLLHCPTRTPLSRFTPVMVSRYNLGKVLGAGSFGVVREAKEKSTDRHYACKTIPKVPKRGLCTPRYLLKLQTEVDVMQQLGASLDSVYLKVDFSSKNYLYMSLRMSCVVHWHAAWSAHTLPAQHRQC